MSSKEMRFSLADQRAFARLSGDFNPIHVDPAAARRTAVGEPIVHGMHAVLRALDRHFAQTASPVTISARFERPIIVGDTVRIERTGATAVALTLDGTLPLATIRVERGRVTRDDAEVPTRKASPLKASARPKVRTLKEVQGAEGVVALTQSKAIARQFPHAARAFGATSVAALAAISRVIGMECPGRDSMLSALSVHLGRTDETGHLHWRVSRVDSRFGLVQIEMNGGGLRGTVDAFVRPAPLPAPSWASVASAVEASEFAGQRALVVGGSRGLGATTAQLVAAGGGVALATFAAGKNEAAVIQRDASQAGARLTITRFDVMRDSANVLAQACKRFRPTHLYYFATPRIFGRRRDPFDAERFRVFADFYVDGFATVCRAAMAAVETLDVFYPSTTGLGTEVIRELTEYTAAKAAGEALAASLNASIPGLTITVQRLPRVATDQTATVLPVPAAQPIAVMLPILRELHRRSRAGR